MGIDWFALVPSDPLWIFAALVLGLLAKAMGVPPLVGFLLAGFGLSALGTQPSAFIEEAADLGITLLLFTIGLHMTLRMFARPEVWGVAVAHAALFTAVLSGMLFVVTLIPGGPIAGAGIEGAASVALALSFSSTVFAAKALEARGAERTRHGRLAMGVLIIQDLIAVVFLVAASDTRPSIWALALFALPLLRRPLQALMEYCGHGELLLLFGVVTAVGGAAAFEAVGLKGDLGALAAGLLLAGTAKADELGKILDGFKDLFLAAFFVSVGLTSPTDVEAMLFGLALLVLLPLKAFGFFVLFTRARLRSRTAWQTSLDLSTFSEFGLIVAAVAVEAELLPPAALAAIAVAVAGSLVAASPVVERGDALYHRWRHRLRPFQRPNRLPGDEDLHLRPVSVVVFGLGRIGSAALEAVHAPVLGVDVDPAVVARHEARGGYVVTGDATDPEFWSRTEDLVQRLDWVLLTMSSHEANMAATDQLRDRGFTGRLVATSRYTDQAEELRRAGADAVFDVFVEAGSGFAAALQRQMRERPS